MGPEDVVVKDKKAYAAILNTIPKSDRAFIKLGTDGKIDKKLADSHVSKSGNFNSLKTLVDDKSVTVCIFRPKVGQDSDHSRPGFWTKVGQDLLSLFRSI